MLGFVRKMMESFNDVDVYKVLYSAHVRLLLFYLVTEDQIIAGKIGTRTEEIFETAVFSSQDYEQQLRM